MLFFFIFTITSYFNDAYKLLYLDLFQYLTYFSFAYLVILLCEYIEINTVVKFSSFIITIVVFLISIIGILQAFGYNIFNLPSLRLPGSTLADRPFAAEYIAGAFPWVLLSSTYFNNKKIKMLFGLLLVIILSYFFLLRGRAGFIALLMGLIFFSTLYLRFFSKKHLLLQLKKYFLYIFLITATGIIIGSLEPSGLSRNSLSNTLLSIYEPNNPRIMYWKASFNMFLENPILGVGAGKWTGIYPKYNLDGFNDSNVLISNVSPHNDYLEILSENGIITFFIYFLLVLLALFRLVKYSKQNAKLLFVAASLFCFLIVSMFSFTKDRTASMILFYLAIGLSFSYPTENNNGCYLIKTTFIKPVLVIIMLISLFYFYLRIVNEEHLILAIKHKNKGKYHQMINKLYEIDKIIYPIDPNQMPVSYFLGLAYLKLNNNALALSYFNDALLLSPETPALKNNIAATHYALGHKEKAKNILIKLKYDFPNYIEPQINLLVLYTNSGYSRKAKKLIKYIESLYMKYIYEEGYKQNIWQNYQSYRKHIENNKLFLNIKKYYSNVHEGDVFKYKNDQTVYLLDNGNKRKFINANVYLNSGYVWDDIIVISDTIVFPDGKFIDNIIIRNESITGNINL